MKYKNQLTMQMLIYVAPYTGAWIEIKIKLRKLRKNRVAPYTGAWIEMPKDGRITEAPVVAPYTGAWIEIQTKLLSYDSTLSRTLHGCVD